MISPPSERAVRDASPKASLLSESGILGTYNRTRAVGLLSPFGINSFDSLH